MRRRQFSFDWKGASFALTSVLCAVALGSALQLSLPSIDAYAAPSQEAAAAQVPARVEKVQALSTTTPERVINTLTIADVVPKEGKFIAADLVNMKLYLYENGSTTAEYPILSKGKVGTPYETPGGYYTILSKELNHFNAQEGVNMPYSMQFYGNYFIHGWPTYADGTPVSSSYSGGCIRLSTADAARVYEFADPGTGVFVYDPGSTVSVTGLTVDSSPPKISAQGYLVADIDDGDVYAEQDAQDARPIASLTKLMTALVANETIMFNDDVSITRGDLVTPSGPEATDTKPETFVVGNLLYPLLMESNNHVAETLARYYNTNAFVDWMNAEARALDMASTTFTDPSGISRNNVSTPEDLFRLAVYLADKKSFIWKITSTPQKTISAENGSTYSFANFNEFAGDASFIGGKVGETDAAGQTMVSVFSVPVAGEDHRIAIIILHSSDDKSDTQKLLSWFERSATSTAGCPSCARAPTIEQ